MRSVLFIFSIVLTQFILAGNVYMGYTSEGFMELQDFNATIDLSKVDVDLIEAGVYYLSNVYRAEHKAKMLTYNEQLSDAAYLHSQQMEKYDFFNHVNKKNRELGNLEKRVQHVGYNNFETIAENIFYGYINIHNAGTYKELCQFIVANFIASKEHEENILAKDVKEAGNGIFFQSSATQGYWYFYFTQDFGSRL